MHEPAGLICCFIFMLNRLPIAEKRNMDNVTHLFDFLKRSHVHIKDWGKVEEKVQSLIMGRQNKQQSVQIVADFDFTLTKFHNNGQKVPSTYDVMESYSNWPMECKEAISLLKSNYYQIDNDPLKTIKEKTPFLLDLLRDAFKIIQCSRLQESNFKSMIEESSIQFREGIKEFFEHLNKANIPLLIISAGLGNIILELLNKHSFLEKNIEIIANHVKYSKVDEIIDAVSSQFVHPYNKGDISSRLSNSYFKNLPHCNNIILLGDSLGDLQMSNGANAIANTELTIGFLNEKIEQSLENYTEHFDIVLVDDQTFDLPNLLIKLVVG